MKLHTTKELADLFGVSVFTIQHWCAMGKLQSYKIGKCWMVPDESVQDFLVRCQSKAGK